MTQAAEIGPVEYLIVAFPGNKFRGQIAPAVADLVEAGTIRIRIPHEVVVAAREWALANT